MTTTPILLLHGALGASDQFHALVTALGADRPVHAVDLPGHGASTGGTPYDVAAFSAHLAALLDQPADVFGYSMGGYVALHLARHYPDAVRRVCTLATKLAWTPEVAEREAGRIDPDRLEARAPDFVAGLAARHSGAGWRSVVAGTSDLLRSLGTAPAVTPDVLAGLRQPARICVGDRDEMVSVEESLAAYRALPQGELQVLPGVRHPLELVPTATLAALVRDAFRDGAG